MLDARDTRRTLAGDDFDTPRGVPTSAGPRNIGQAYGQRAKGSFPVLGPLWKAGKRRLALSNGQRTTRPAKHERFPQA